MKTHTLNVSVRPSRLAVLVDANDEHWAQTCKYVLEFLSSAWGGCGGVIIPTDGTIIDPLFWEILEAFDPDYIYCYGQSLFDVELRDPSAFEQIYERNVQAYREQIGGHEGVSGKEIRKQLRWLLTSDFEISELLQRELKARLAPFHFKESIVELGFLRANAVARYPNSDVLDLVAETVHPSRIFLPSQGFEPLAQLWYSAAIGSCSAERIPKLEEVGFQPVLIGRNSELGNEADQVRRLVGLCVLRDTHQHLIDLPLPPGSQTELRSTYTINDLSALNLGRYRSILSSSFAVQTLAIVGNTIADFCFYLGLSRLRERVFWLFPNLTSRASRGESGEARCLASLSFVSALRDVYEYQNEYASGLAVASASMTPEELPSFLDRIKPYDVNLVSARIEVENSSLVPPQPVRLYEHSNATLPHVVLVPEDGVIPLFHTPKPRTFRNVNPNKHRWIAEVQIRHYALPRHPELGNWLVGQGRHTTKEARASSEGLAYFCPNIFIMGGQDIDAIVVRPDILIPSPRQLFERLATVAGLTCSFSDKGFYAEDTMAKFGGLERVASLLRSAAGRAILTSFRDKQPPLRGKHDRGVLIENRRYQEFNSLVRLIGNEAEATRLIDQLSRVGALYKGFVLQCEFCRNSEWFPLKELSDCFTCPRCHREQRFTSKHWKFPNQPNLYYQLDEVIYQGLMGDMHVPLLALDTLRRTSRESFMFVNELEYRKNGLERPFIECDINCVVDGDLTLGEAKSTDRLDPSRPKEVKIAQAYRELCSALGARRVVFATESDAWNAETLRVVRETFQQSSAKLIILTNSDLYS